MAGVAGPAARRLLLVAGDARWGTDWVLARLPADARDAVLWVAAQAPPGVEALPAGRFAQRLGSECGLLVFDAHQGFHPDAFAALVGTLRGGGDCVLLAPALADWAGFADPDKARFACHPRPVQEMHGHFLARLAERWPGRRGVLPVSEGGAGDLDLRIAPAVAGVPALNAAQRAAVAAVESVARGHARRPLVLRADRGRGKSTLLGVAAARLLQDGLARVTVVAPHRAAAATLFAQAQAAAGLPPQGVADTRIGSGTLCFRLPAECLADSEAPGLVLVDEAAAIPAAVLGRLLDRANRLVFASTVHGYEGSGRGFELRFQQELARRMPQWRSLGLTAPVRWAADDPLEALVNDAFLLDAELDEVEPDAAPVPDDPVIAAIEPARLQRDEGLLRSIFGLLVNAHYQTRPSDLRQLLDNPDDRLWVARRGGAVVGVLLASLEGGLDTAMAERVLSGDRRPRGHLLPQSLAVHAGLEACLGQRVARVQRIAVHPRLQRHGIASRLLQRLERWAAAERVDLLGCAFGAEPSLLAFWRANGFLPVRLGVRVDPASAAHSLFMLRGLSAAGESLAGDGARRFLAGLPWSLAAGLRDLDSRLAGVLLRGRDCRDLELDGTDRLALRRVAAGARAPATADAVVWKALVRIAAHGAPEIERFAPLVAAYLQHRSAAQLCETFSVCGRRELEGRLRALLGERQETLGYRG